MENIPVKYKKLLTHLRKHYEEPGHPISFAGVDAIWRYFDKKVPKNVLKTFLTQFESFSLHQGKKRQRQFIPCFEFI